MLAQRTVERVLDLLASTSGTNKISYYGRKRTNSPTDHRFTLTMHVDLTKIGTVDREDGQSLTHDIELIATVINRSKKSIL